MSLVLYVLEIADCRSISAAAARLYLSQSALSQQVQRLEAELGYTLFSRTPRGLTLTPSGEKFCREARAVADTWRSFCGKVHPGGQSRRPLRVGLGARVYSNYLFQDVVRFFEEHPDMEVNFVTESGRDMLAGLRDGSIDFALDRLQAGDETGQDMFVCDLVQERQCLIMAQSDPLASRESVAFRDLHGKTVISGAVPVVGGILSDTAEALLAGADALRGTIGTLGIFTVLALCMAPLLRLAAQYVLYRLTAFFCGMTGSEALRGFLEQLSSAFALMLAMTAGGAFVLLAALMIAIRMVMPA